MKFWEALKAIEEGKCVVLKGSYCPAYNIYSLYTEKWRNLLIQGHDKEWELYEGQEKTYNFSEVVQGIKEGKKFKRRNWGSVYLKLGSMCIMLSFIQENQTEYGVNWHATIEECEATDWVEVV